MLPTPLDLSQRSSRATTTTPTTQIYEEHRLSTGQSFINKLIEKKYLEIKNINCTTPSLKGNFVFVLKSRTFFFLFSLLISVVLCLKYFIYKMFLIQF